MLIGQLANASGFSQDTLRYYEKIGLLRPAARRASRYREYSHDALQILRFIKRSKRMGFTLAEIRSILTAVSERNLDCERAGTVVKAKLAHFDAEIAKLQGYRRELLNLMQVCDPESGSRNCPGIDAIWHEDKPA